jgi:hypothetical protein
MGILKQQTPSPQTNSSGPVSPDIFSMSITINACHINREMENNLDGIFHQAKIAR